MSLILHIYASLALLGASIFDIKKKKVPNKYIYLIVIICFFMLFLGVKWKMITSNELLISMWKSLFIVFITFGIAYLIGKIRHIGSLGAADFKLAIFLSVLYNMDEMICFIVFMLVFSGAGYIIMVGFNKMETSERFPLVPFMFLGSLAVICMGGILR